MKFHCDKCVVIKCGIELYRECTQVHLVKRWIEKASINICRKKVR